MQLSDEMLKEISYIKISKYRTKVMKSLDEGEVLIPTQIARNSDIRPNHISKVLAELKAHELVECINPEVRKGRLYRLTDKGDELVKNIDD
ncbi:MAG: transcriptional regulator [Methanobrevibacter millerae]|uniref:Transcriptional regulator n=2 Tax=Methanobrevibacter millerae TaxID=230361 RepID=A0A8T3VLB1_9EURY|nr:transcriptional regulator [Methanobrevibacter thaueri]MBE6505470.1 transcriptional regulator [Methanobrevibacter millerae]